MADARVKAELRARGPDPLRSVAIALSMIGAVRARPGPHYDDPVRRRGVEQVRAIWQRLREATFASEARRPTELERVPPPLWRRSSVLSRR